MTVEELKEFLDHCDPNASILITDRENEKYHMLLTSDIDYFVSQKVLRIDI